MKPELLAVETAEPGQFWLLAEASPGGAWRLALDQAQPWAVLPDCSFRRLASPNLAVVALTPCTPWVLPTPVRGRLAARLWRPLPWEFALGRATDRGVEWHVQPSIPSAAPLRLAHRNTPKVDAWRDAKGNMPQSQSVLNQIDAYRAVAQAMVGASPALVGTITADLEIDGRRVELAVQFKSGNAHFSGLANSPQARSEELALQPTPPDRPPLAGSAPHRSLRGWVWGRLEASGWRFADVGELAAHAAANGVAH